MTSRARLSVLASLVLPLVLLGACGQTSGEGNDEDGRVSSGGAQNTGSSSSDGEDGGAGTGSNSGAGGGASDGGSHQGAGGAEGGAGGAREGVGGSDAGTGGATIACFACGPPVLCEESCEDACGCCCTENELVTGEDGVARRCQDGCLADPEPQADPWTRFTSSSGAGLCSPEFPCTRTYEVSPDGTLLKTDGDALEQLQMSLTDLAFVDAYASDADFRALMQGGFDCGPPPTDVWALFSLQTERGEDWTQGVTGCVYGGGGDDAVVVEQIRSILDHY